MIHRSIVLKLFLAFLAVALVAVGTVAYLTNRAMSSNFSQYLRSSDEQRARRIQQQLEAYYQREGNWLRVQPFLLAMTNTTGDRIFLTDAREVVIADSANEILGHPLKKSPDTLVLPIRDSGQEVAFLYLSPSSHGPAAADPRIIPQSRFLRQMLLMMERLPPPNLAEASRQFLRSFRNSLVWAGLAAALLAIALSLLFIRQITVPLRRLRFAARAIARGDLSHRVPLSTRDEIGELASSFNAMAESLEKNEKLRRSLIADIAHELRTPITVIQGSLEAIMDGVMQPTPERIQSIHEETKLLSRLVADLRDLSLAETGTLTLERHPTDLADLLENAVNRMEVEAVEKGVHLQLQAQPGLPPALADGQRIEQVVYNLLTNALKYTPAQGTITVGLERLDGNHAINQPQALVWVQDTGIGIPAEDLPYVFERFYRVDKSRSRATGGTGLGLAIARQLVELHGGSIWAESQPGQGSKFSFTLNLDGGVKEPVKLTVG